MFCIKCGAKLAESAAFCINCGAHVEAGSKSVPQPPANTAPLSAPIQAEPIQAVPNKPAVISVNTRPRQSATKVKKSSKLPLILGIGIPVLMIIAFVIWVLPLMLVGHASSVVDSSGGTAELGNLQLQFGEGIVDSSVNIDLTSSNPGGDAKPDGLESALYMVNMDTAVDNPVTIKIKSGDNMDPETTFIGVGVGITDDSGKTTYHYKFLETTVKDGYAVAQITPTEEGSLVAAPVAYAADNKPEAGIYGASGGKKTTVRYMSTGTNAKVGYAKAKTASGEESQLLAALLTQPQTGAANTADKPENLHFGLGLFQCYAYNENGHFKLFYPGVVNKPDSAKLLADMEDVYSYYEKLNYDFTMRTDWPIKVSVTKSESLSIKGIEEDDGAYIESPWMNAMNLGRTPNSGYIELNKKYFLGEYKSYVVKPVFAHEFFHFIQANYESRGAATVKWWDEATASYYEWKISGNVPNIVGQNKAKVFEGLIPSVNDQANGYGRMSVAAFSESQYGGSAIADIYADMASGMSLKDAMKDILGNDPPFWAGDCFQFILSGKASDFAPYDAWSSLANGADHSKSDYSDFGATMELKYPPADEIEQAQSNGEPIVLSEGTVNIPALGAKVLAVTVDEGLSMNLAAGMTLQFKTQNGVDIRLFKIKGKDFTVVKGSDYAVDVDTFKEDMDGKVNYLLLLTNLSEISAATVNVSAEIQECPTLDELVGSFDDGKLTVTDVFLSQEIRDEAKANSSSSSGSSSGIQGCDLNMIDELDKLKGQSYDYKFTIEKTGNDTGNLTIYSDNGNTILPFTYKNGVLQIDYTIPETESNGTGKITSNMVASYGDSNDVKVKGVLHMTSVDYADDFYIDCELSGSHALPPKS